MQTQTDIDLELLQQARDLAISLAEQVGDIQRAAVRDGSAIHHKGRIDLVTDADIESEKIITAAIRQAYPDHRLTGEEGGVGAEESPYRWLIDPIDGTTNFAHRHPHWAVSICLEHRSTPVMGVVYDVPKREMFTAIIGQGAYLNDEPISVSSIADMEQAAGATGFSYDISERHRSFRLWEAFNNGAQAMRRNGAAALDVVWVACGRLEFYFEAPINNWDVSAGVVIAREAGGTVSRLDGSEYHIDDREIAVSNSLLHDDMVNLIRRTVE